MRHQVLGEREAGAQHKKPKAGKVQDKGGLRKKTGMVSQQVRRSGYDGKDKQDVNRNLLDVGQTARRFNISRSSV